MAIPSLSVDTTSGTSGDGPGDAFDVLQLEPAFDLDPDLLAERHRALSLALHPDRFAGRPAGERRLSLERSMQINAAYRALRDPIERARVLAQRLGIPQETEVAHDLELLERTMAQREALSAAVFDGDQARIAQLAREAEHEQTTILQRLGALFAASDRDAAAARLPRLLSQLRFARRFVESAEAELEAH